MSQHTDTQSILNNIVKSAQYVDHFDLAESDDAQDILASQAGVCLWRGTATIPAALYSEEGEEWVVWSVHNDGFGSYLVKAYHKPVAQIAAELSI